MSSAQANEALGHLLAHVCKLHYARARALFETVGLYRGQPPLLRALTEREGLSHSELASRLNVALATVSKMLDRMERAGFVLRKPDAQDQRVSRVYLTERGHEAQGEVAQLLQTMEQETFAGFTEEELGTVRVFLGRMRENLSHAATEGEASC